jgi:hypothetical protein
MFLKMKNKSVKVRPFTKYRVPPVFLCVAKNHLKLMNGVEISVIILAQDIVVT